MSFDLPRPRDARSPTSAHVPGAVVIALALAPRFFRPILINHDSGWYLYAAGRLLDGARPYLDIVDTNPPLALYLHAVPVWISRVFGIDPVTSFTILVAALVLAATVATAMILSRSEEFRGSTTNFLVVLLVGGLLGPLAGGDYGQREHVLVLALTPYLAGAWVRMRGVALRPGVRFTLGFAAAAGAMLKPPFLLVFLPTEWVAGRVATGTVNPARHEIRGIAAAVLGYAASFLFFDREMLDALVSTTAMALEQYRAYERSLGSDPRTILSLLPSAALVVWSFAIARDRPARLLGALGVLAWGIAVAQRKGWSYHFLPALVIAGLGLGGLAILRLRQSIVTFEQRAWRRGVVATVTVLVLASVGLESRRRHSDPPYGSLDPLVAFLSHPLAGDSFVAFETGIFPSFPLVNYTGARWPLRFPCLWMLPSIYGDQVDEDGRFPYHDPGARSKVEQFMINAIVADLERDPPDLVLVRKIPPSGFASENFNVLELLVRDDRFRRWWVAEAYRNLGRVGFHDVYRRGR